MSLNVVIDFISLHISILLLKKESKQMKLESNFQLLQDVFLYLHTSRIFRSHNFYRSMNQERSNNIAKAFALIALVTFTGCAQNDASYGGQGRSGGAKGDELKTVYWRWTAKDGRFFRSRLFPAIIRRRRLP